MALGTSAWLTAARLWNRRQPRLDFPGRRRELIDRLTPGRSFIDVGGMWGIDGEMAFRAEEAGAERVVLFDSMEATEGFVAERERRGSSVEFVSGDLHDAETMAALGQFDVVWCTGVVYHSPSPFQQLEHLRRLCADKMMLGTRVLPEVPGIENACILYPGLSESARRSLHRAHGGKRAPEALGITAPFDPDQGYANWWWGITPSALRSMVEAAGFTITEEMRANTFVVDLLAEVDDGAAREAR